MVRLLDWAAIPFAYVSNAPRRCPGRCRRVAGGGGCRAPTSAARARPDGPSRRDVSAVAGPAAGWPIQARGGREPRVSARTRGRSPARAVSDRSRARAEGVEISKLGEHRPRWSHRRPLSHRPRAGMGRDRRSGGERRLDYMVAELAACQRANGNGYVGGVPGGRELWSEVAAGQLRVERFGLNGKWVPVVQPPQAVRRLARRPRDRRQRAGARRARAPSPIGRDASSSQLSDAQMQ